MQSVLSPSTGDHYVFTQCLSPDLLLALSGRLGLFLHSQGTCFTTPLNNYQALPTVLMTVPGRLTTQVPLSWPHFRPYYPANSTGLQGHQFPLQLSHIYQLSSQSGHKRSGVYANTALKVGGPDNLGAFPDTLGQPMSRAKISQIWDLIG